MAGLSSWGQGCVSRRLLPPRGVSRGQSQRLPPSARLRSREGSGPDGPFVQNVDLSAATFREKDGESVAHRLSRPAEVKTQSEKELSYRKMFSGTLQIVEALAQLFLTEMLESTDQEPCAERISHGAREELGQEPPLLRFCPH